MRSNIKVTRMKLEIDSKLRNRQTSDTTNQGSKYTKYGRSGKLLQEVRNINISASLRCCQVGNSKTPYDKRKKRTGRCSRRRWERQI